MYKIQFRDVETGRLRNVATTDEEATLALVKAASAQGDPEVVELRVRVSTETRFGTEWADVTALAVAALKFS